MESQKDRFTRELMERRDDRKDRGFDRQSIERKQRIMPQGQKDLGIYPGETPSISYGVQGPIEQLDDPEMVDLNIIFTLNLTKSLSSKDAVNTLLMVTVPDLVFNNCKLAIVYAATQTVGMPSGEIVQLHPSTFNNCTFVYNLDMFVLTNNVFNNCDFTEYQIGLTKISKTNDPENKENYRAGYEGLFSDHNTYNNCKLLTFDAAWAAA